jgi:hypothetical protein
VTLQTISPREASIFACLTETVVQPTDPLPPVSHTDAVASFDRWMARSPAPNRAGIRVLLYAFEAGPLLAGFRRRARRLAPADRLRYVERVEHAPVAQIRQIAKLMKGMSFVSYYGDDALLRALGYDPDAKLERGRELRAREGRP